MRDKKKEDTYSYKGWLVSDRFLKRAFAVIGHAFIAQITIYAVLLLVAIFFAGIATLFT